MNWQEIKTRMRDVAGKVQISHPGLSVLYRNFLITYYMKKFVELI